MTRRGAFQTMWVTATRRAGDDVAGLGSLLVAVPRMFGAALTGRYPLLDRKRIALALGGLLYIVSPVDLVPELFLFVFGTADDAVVATWVAGALLSEAEVFRDWERTVRGAGAGAEHPHVVHGESD